MPPTRVVEHYIDLIAGVMPPNKPAYRMNPKESMEI